MKIKKKELAYIQSQKDIVRYHMHHVAGFDWCRIFSVHTVLTRGGVLQIYRFSYHVYDTCSGWMFTSADL
jgi:hypothetical protein